MATHKHIQLKSKIVLCCKNLAGFQLLIAKSFDDMKDVLYAGLAFLTHPEFFTECFIPVGRFGSWRIWCSEKCGVR